MKAYKKRKHLLLLILFIIFDVLISACEEDIETNMSDQMENFSFIIQDEESLELEDLRGDWWMTYMSYTNCRAVCP